MKVIALHLEYKQDGLPGRSGPGDTLRLAHALRHPMLAGRDVLLLTTSKPETVKDLFRRVKIKSIPSAAQTTKAGQVNLSSITNLLIEHAAEYLADSEVMHAYIGSECTRRSATYLDINGISIIRRRIDLGTPENGLMFHSRWKPPNTVATCSESRVGIFIRQMATEPMLNTPSWFIEQARSIASKLGWSILWCGDTGDVEIVSDEEALDFRGKSLWEQIADIRSRVKCAMGWNSGGLDLAAASGVPILRIGEYPMRQT